MKMCQSGGLNNKEVKKLLINLDFSSISEDIRIVSKPSSVVEKSVSLYKMDITNKEATIRYLSRKNKNFFL